jgi:penicillin amidase
MRQPLDRVFSRGPYPVGGDTDTPNQMAMLPHEPYEAKAWGPSYRQIIDLGDLSRSMAIIPPGQSGHLGNQHYDDLVEPWLKGEYHPMLWTREQVIEHAEGRLLLKRP